MHGHQPNCTPADLDRFLHTTNRLSLINCATVLIDNEIDPDMNAFDVHETTTKYYLPAEFADTVGHVKLKNKLSILHLNSHSLVNKLLQLEIFLSSLSYNFDIIAITET